MLGKWPTARTRTGSRQDRPPVPGFEEAAVREVWLPLSAMITYTSEDQIRVQNFLRCYRLWTHSICAVGHKGWPGVDRSDLDLVV